MAQGFMASQKLCLFLISTKKRSINLLFLAQWVPAAAVTPIKKI
jgi:hypothetical protein